MVVAVLDDGIDRQHPDLKQNIFSETSFDFISQTKNESTPNAMDGHGTKCAGDISALKNDICGVGVAFDSKISDLRILSYSKSFDPSSLHIAEAFNYAFDKNHVYSCSWGPLDDGESLAGPSPLVQKALEKGIQSGRHGKGSIYVFGSGNGGRFRDNWYIQ